MDKRRLSLLPVLVLLAVRAQASEHTVECFAGLTPEKRQAISLRASCGVRLYEFVAQATTDTVNDANAPGGAPGGGPGPRPDPNTGAAPATGQGATYVMKSAVFLFAEAAEYVAGRDSGKRLDNWMFGLRFIMNAQGTVEPFVHLMGGRQRPSRLNDLTADDTATRSSSAFGVGVGVDIETNRLMPGERPPAIVPVIRLQLDGLDPGGGLDRYGRVTLGVSFRFEGHHK